MPTKKGSEVLAEVIKLFGDNYKAIGLVDRYPQTTRYGIFYGPEKVFAFVPVIIIDGVTKDTELTATGLRGTFLHTVTFIVCHFVLGEASTTARTESLERAETIESLFYDNPSLNNLVVHGFIQSIDEGNYHTENQSYFAHQLVWQGFSKERVTRT